MFGGKSFVADRRWEKERKCGHTVTIDNLGLAGGDNLPGGKCKLDVRVIITRECHEMGISTKCPACVKIK